jgi:hypothetical protein
MTAEGEGKAIPVTSHYPQMLIQLLEELSEETHIPKARHLREALRQYLQAQGRLPKPLFNVDAARVPVIISARYQRHASLPEMYALITIGKHLYPATLDAYLSSDETLRTGRTLEGTFVLLGGPKNNAITAEVLAALDAVKPLTLRMEINSDTGAAEIHDKRTGQRLRSDQAVEEQVPTDFNDYGLAVAAPHPQTGKNVYICAGCHAFGTYAALRALTEPDLVVTLLRRLSSPTTPFECLVHTRVRNFVPETPTILDVVER